MNSLELYDFTIPVASDTSSSSSNTEASSLTLSTITAETSQPTLNEEVTQVMGQLGKLWGGVRKQSQSAFDSARKELEKLSQQPVANQENVQSNVSDENESGNVDHDCVPEGSTFEADTSGGLPASSSFLSRLQSSLPPNLTATALSSTLQRHLPENLQHGLNLENANADFTQLRATLATNIQRVQQDTTVQQAEKLAEQYMHRGSALFREAGEFLKDAVKVLPPEESGEAPGVVWDGTDVWTTPSPIQTNVGRGASRKGKDKETDVLFCVPRAAAKRADVLLKKLRRDPELIRADPDLGGAAIKELWLVFVKDEVDANGGIAGEVWTKRTSAALEGHDKDEDAEALSTLRDQLVPAELTNDAFWTRYFFRVHQIERDEEKRKALLADANQDDDDFTWEDEEDAEDSDEYMSRSQANVSMTPVNTSSTTVNTSSNPSADNATSVTPPKAPSSISQTPVNVSPRESEDSYDVVSSSTVSSTGRKPGEKKPKVGEKGGENGDDSDWE